MKKSAVYFLPSRPDENESQLAARLEKFLAQENLLGFIEERDFVAIKTHFGEEKTDGFVRPIYIKKIADLIKKQKALPFLTETSTLYSGKRSNAVEHILLAEKHNFKPEITGVPIIMADGLWGDEEIEVKIQAEIFSTVQIAALLKKIQALVVVTHFTGHILTGFGAALKNLGMGLASRKGKMKQHSTVKPKVKEKKCTGCGVCLHWCPVEAILFDNQKAFIDLEKCIGCGECLTVCRFDAIAYNWSENQEILQKKMVEHAAAVLKLFEKKRIFFTFLLRITKDCDCMAGFQKICDDIGILISSDPVAIDAAALKLVEDKLQKPLARLAYNVNSHIQLEYASRLNLGCTDFQLLPVNPE